MMTHHMGTIGYGAIEETSDLLRKVVYTAEEAILGREQVLVPVVHKFAHGIYIREIFLKKGYALTGRIHKQDDYQIVYFGDISILTENGLKRFTGPNGFTSKAGVKPYAFAHEDTLFSTAHHTHLTDLEEIERELFEDEPQRLLDFKTGELLQGVLPCQR
jgi:hypothetical protein